jgi:hypothetical protein
MRRWRTTPSTIPIGAARAIEAADNAIVWAPPSSSFGR